MKWGGWLVSRKHKHQAGATVSIAQLRARVERAASEGRFQQALELAKSIYKAEATPEHRTLLLQTYLGRAQQLRNQGQTRDAATTLQAALQVGSGDAAWTEQVARELAACGAVKPALDLVSRLPESAAAAVLAAAADAAVAQEQAGRALLPENLRDEFDRVLSAFSQLTAGQDDAARETLQPIGLRSPFLEWKVLLRGLAAYYQQDDPRALENWQRLLHDRLPARLIAPCRYQIDPAFRTAQSPEAQNVLRKLAESLQDAGPVVPLRQIQSALAGHQALATAFRLAEGAVSALRQHAPHLVPRLAACFYWAIIHDGQPTDLPRYQRIFGSPAEDPRLERLEALACEHRQDMEGAHQFWQKYEKTVAAAPAVWPAGAVDRVRALIWLRMAHNAAGIPDAEEMKQLPAFLRDHPSRPMPLKPPADQCFRRSLELAPDQLPAHEALFHYYRERRQSTKAVAAARALLERFPEHVATLAEYGDLCMEQQDYVQAVDLYQRALKVNPLDRQLRHKASGAHLFHARAFAEVGQFAEARAEYQAALAFHERGTTASVLCKWAACEFKADDTARAEELLRQALAQPGNELAVAYSMLIEVIRLKLPRGLKQRFDRDFNEALNQPATGAGAAAIAETTAAHALAGIQYHGQKTHQKKVLAYLQKAIDAEFTESQLEETCTALRHLKVARQLAAFTRLGQQRFPTNPAFYLIEAQGYLDRGPHNIPHWKVTPLLTKARELAQALPPDPRQKQLLEQIQQAEQVSALASPFMNIFESLLEQFAPFGDGDGLEDDWEDDDEDVFDSPFGGGHRGRRRR